MKIAIINDVSISVEMIRRIVADRSTHQIIWVASNGVDALRLCRENLPDLILMDIVMPIMDGVETTRKIMTEFSCAILIVTAYTESLKQKVFDAMAAGALDAVSIPTLNEYNKPLGASALLSKIDAIQHLQNNHTLQNIIRSSRPKIGVAKSSFNRAVTKHSTFSKDQLIVIGCSAGGPPALSTILKALPSDFSTPIVIIQHLDEPLAKSFAKWLCDQSSIPVSLAKEGDTIQPNRILVADAKNHLVFINSRTLGYLTQRITTSFCPSVDIFFTSVAASWKGDVIGVLLTGMGSDGAEGLKLLREKGFHTIAQDQATSAVYGMPKKAFMINAAKEILPLYEIAPALQKLTND